MYFIKLDVQLTKEDMRVSMLDFLFCIKFLFLGSLEKLKYFQ